MAGKRSSSSIRETALTPRSSSCNAQKSSILFRIRPKGAHVPRSVIYSCYSGILPGTNGQRCTEYITNTASSHHIFLLYLRRFTGDTYKENVADMGDASEFRLHFFPRLLGRLKCIPSKFVRQLVHFFLTSKHRFTLAKLSKPLMRQIY